MLDEIVILSHYFKCILLKSCAGSNCTDAIIIVLCKFKDGDFTTKGIHIMLWSNEIKLWCTRMFIASNAVVHIKLMRLGCANKENIEPSSRSRLKQMTHGIETSEH